MSSDVEPLLNSFEDNANIVLHEDVEKFVMSDDKTNLLSCGKFCFIGCSLLPQNLVIAELCLIHQFRLRETFQVPAGSKAHTHQTPDVHIFSKDNDIKCSTLPFLNLIWNHHSQKGKNFDMW